MRTAIKTLAVAATVGTMSMSSASAATAVDIELALLVDVSGSIDSNEFALQRDGYVNAFKDAAVQAAMFGGPIGSIAATLIYWSDANEQSVAVGWTHINNSTAADDFADAIAGFARPFATWTAPGSAINYVTPQFASNMFDGTEQIIDVSGDGVQNRGADTATARNNALAAGVDQINGLAIGNEAGLVPWYNANIKGGAGAFVIASPTFNDFGDAIKDKMLREVGEVPLPAPVLMLGAALGGLGFLRRKRA